MRTTAVFVATALLAAASAVPAAAHCQVPCGIFGDELRVQMMEEDVATIEKAMRQVVALGKETPVNYNQVVRWVMTKDDHAQKIQDTVAAYFLAQRIKAPAEVEGEPWERYTRQLVLLHTMTVEAMKCKQTTDLAHVERLRVLLREFRDAYFGPQAAHTH